MNIEMNKQLPYWYSRKDFENFEIENKLFQIRPLGCNHIKLKDKHTNKVISEIDDENGEGTVGMELSKYFKDDKDLLLALDDKHPLFVIESKYMNCWSVDYITDDGDYNKCIKAYLYSKICKVKNDLSINHKIYAECSR